MGNCQGLLFGIAGHRLIYEYEELGESATCTYIPLRAAHSLKPGAKEKRTEPPPQNIFLEWDYFYDYSIVIMTQPPE